VKSIIDENRTRDGFASANSRPGDQRAHMGKDEGELMSRLTYREKYKMISLLSISTPRFEQPSRASRVTRTTRTSKKRRSLSHRLSNLLRSPFSLSFSVSIILALFGFLPPVGRNRSVYRGKKRACSSWGIATPATLERHPA